jgi:hypothetical protein
MQQIKITTVYDANCQSQLTGKHKFSKQQLYNTHNQVTVVNQEVGKLVCKRLVS